MVGIPTAIHEEDITMAESRTVKYGDLKDGMRVWFHGYKATISGVRSEKHLSEYYPGERIMRFTAHFDEDQDIARYGQYQDGTYGGVEHLELETVGDEHDRLWAEVHARMAYGESFDSASQAVFCR